MNAEPKWLEWARSIAGIAQSGKHYTRDPFDRERFEKLEALAAEIIAGHADVDREALGKILAAEVGYATPKVDVRAVVFNRGGELLMVRESLDGGKWTVPGGWADVNVTPSENTEREVLEEAGYRVRAVKLLACYDRRLHGHPPFMFHLYKLVFRCELLDDKPVPSPQGNLESEESRFFAESELPAESELSTGRVTRSQLARFFEHLRNPALPTDFD